MSVAKQKVLLLRRGFFFFLFLGKVLQPVLHQTVYRGIFTVLMYKLEWFNSVVCSYVTVEL